MHTRDKRIDIFNQTKDICECDQNLKSAIERSKEQQVIYWEGTSIPAVEARMSEPTMITVSKSKTVEAARKYASSGKKVCILNFASSVSPGGGVVSGAQAQEESICRVSTLYFAISDKKTAGSFYDRHWELIGQKKMNRRNTDDIIYTPGIIAIRDDSDNENLLDADERYSMDVITCAAPDIRCVGDDTEYSPSKKALYDEFVKRWKFILAAGAKHLADVLILGAFGCGVFANPPELVASAFCEAFSEFKNHFETIEFAIYCGNDDSNYIAFMEQLKNIPDR